MSIHDRLKYVLDRTTELVDESNVDDLIETLGGWCDDQPEVVTHWLAYFRDEDGGEVYPVVYGSLAAATASGKRCHCLHVEEVTVRVPKEAT